MNDVSYLPLYERLLILIGEICLILHVIMAVHNFGRLKFELPAAHFSE